MSASLSIPVLLLVFVVDTLKLTTAATEPEVTFTCDGSLASPPSYGSGGYKLRIEGSPEYYQPNRAYTVTLVSTGRQSFRAFHISVRSEEKRLKSEGNLLTFNNFTSQPQEECSVSNMVNTHLGKKSYVRVKWLSPTSSSGCILLKASVHQKGSRWYKDHEKLMTRICEKPKNSPPTENCCACGVARYRMKFYGIWSPQTHPRDYPEYSTHWSNVVGASHSPLYSIWEYGQVSSAAVQQVAEWGFPEKLLHELRAQEEQGPVLSVVKTKAQWPAYPKNGRFLPLVSEFETNQEHFLVSLLSMLGPSPDWNVGISKESMCLTTCGWVGEREFFLTPWDAGTDDGLSYNSPNLPSNPKKPIRPINSTDYPESPFYDPSGSPIPPVARIVIERVALEGEQCGKSEHSSAEDNYDETQGSNTDEASTSTSCMYSEWFDWMPCSVSCGWGLKNRKRMLKQGKEMMCTDLMQTEICKGTDECENNENVTTCIYSDWTSWTRCSASCGDSVRSRQRVMKWPSEPAFCNAPLKEMVQCEQPSCDQACMYLPWSVWMPCSATCGVGSTFRKRALKIGNPEVCNEMMEQSKCMASMSCQSDGSFDIPGCQYGPWTDWSRCPVSCGVGQTFRKRFLTNSTSVNDVSCEDFQMEGSKCMTSQSCSDDDVLASSCRWRQWSSWTRCSVTCGMGVVMRKRTAKSRTSDVECDDEAVEKEVCNPGSCEQRCIYQDWNEWMPCSVSCGSGFTIRKRFLDEQSQDDSNCKSFEMERNRCMTPCPQLVNPEDLSPSEVPVTTISLPEVLTTRKSQTEEPVVSQFPSTEEPSTETPVISESTSRISLIRDQTSEPPVTETRVTETRTTEVLSVSSVSSTLASTMMPSTDSVPETSSLENSASKGEKTEDPVTKKPVTEEPVAPKSDDGLLSLTPLVSPTDSLPTSSGITCETSEWQPWSSCSKTCGRAVKTRKRNNFKDLPKSCEKTQTKKCGKLPRCPRDCVMGDWGPWRSCAKPCSKGNRRAKTYRRRKVVKREKYGGKKCGRSKQFRICKCRRR